VLYRRRADIGVYGFDAQTLEFQGSEMLLVEIVVSALFGWVHVKLLVVHALDWAREKSHEYGLTLPRCGFVQQTHVFRYFSQAIGVVLVAIAIVDGWINFLPYMDAQWALGAGTILVVAAARKLPSKQ